MRGLAAFVNGVGFTSSGGAITRADSMILRRRRMYMIAAMRRSPARVPKMAPTITGALLVDEELGSDGTLPDGRFIPRSGKLRMNRIYQCLFFFIKSGNQTYASESNE